jgi:hypothetical protein
LGGVLPPTSGPSPTPTSTSPPPGPHILRPLPGTEFNAFDDIILFQWVAVKDLADEEWYMVEVTDLSDVDSHPMRAFTRQTSFRIPGAWQPTVEEIHQFRWRVSIVKATGQREDGQFTYTFGGSSSDEGSFSWLGAIPTAVPALPSSTPRPTAEIDSTTP